jgi:hypothetical protein
MQLLRQRFTDVDDLHRGAVCSYDSCVVSALASVVVQNYCSYTEQLQRQTAAVALDD